MLDFINFHSFHSAHFATVNINILWDVYVRMWRHGTGKEGLVLSVDSRHMHTQSEQHLIFALNRWGTHIKWVRSSNIFSWTDKLSVRFTFRFALMELKGCFQLRTFLFCFLTLHPYFSHLFVILQTYEPIKRTYQTSTMIIVEIFSDELIRRKRK